MMTMTPISTGRASNVAIIPPNIASLLEEEVIVDFRVVEVDVIAVHSGIMKSVLTNGHEMSTGSRTLCIDMNCVLINHSCMCVISDIDGTWDIFASFARNVTYVCDSKKHWNAPSIMCPLVNPH